MKQDSALGPRALIVEDEIILALELRDILRALGYVVCGLAPDSKTAVSLAMRSEPDIALVDVCLEGGREGIETARWLRDVCGSSIVFVTAATDQATVERIHERVPEALILPKPVQRDHLAEVVAASVVH